MKMLQLTQPTIFEWDEGNSDKNQLKHNVSNNECEEVFGDPKKVILGDPRHSKGEIRNIIIGNTDRGRLLLIVFTLRKKGSALRIISARDINRRERKFYEKESRE